MAATAPVKPSDFEALLVTESDTICRGLINLAKMTWLLYQLVRWKYDSEGNLTEDYKSLVCSVECPDTDSVIEETTEE